MERNYCKKFHDGGLRKDLVKCTLCNINCDTMEQFDIHVSGKSHMKKLKTVNDLESLIKDTSIGNNFTCQLCNKNMNCKEQYDAHCSGIKHMKKISSINILKNPGAHEHKLLLAAKTGNLQLAELSINMKSDIEICDEENRRPIHYACINGCSDIVKLLMENNCDIQALDKYKKSPLDLANENNYQGIVKILNSAKYDLILKKQIASMGLMCNESCDHKFCSKSFAMKSFSKGVLLHRNHSAEVYRCMASLIGREFAIKCIPVNDIDENNGRNIEENVNHYLEVLQHSRIIQYFGAMEMEKDLCIFMEYLPRGSLDDEIKIRKTISKENVIRYSCQISDGLSYLHGKKIIHRDIKPANILLDGDDNIKLVDFGISRLLTRTDGHTTHTKSVCGTPNFMAPEVIHGEDYTFSADIWSLGATIINMISGHCPYHTLIREAVIFKIGNEKTLILPTENISQPMKKLIEQMINPIPEFRPRASDLVNQKLYQ